MGAELNKLGFMGGCEHQSNVVYGTDGICPTIAGMYKAYINILERKVDEKMQEKKMIMLGQMDNSDGSFEIANRVYSVGGISPTIVAKASGDVQPKIVVAMRKRNAESEEHTCQVLEPNLEGTSNCLTTVAKDNLVLEKLDADEKIRIKQATKKGYAEVKVGGVFDGLYPSSTTRRGRVQNEGEISPTICAEGELLRIEKAYKGYAIRKLTPRECWRLMDFTDEDFDKASAVNSNTQLYKEAGNSIVVNVLVAIMGQMFEGHEEDYKKILDKSLERGKQVAKENN